MFQNKYRQMHFWITLYIYRFCIIVELPFTFADSHLFSWIFLYIYISYHSWITCYIYGSITTVELSFAVADTNHRDRMFWENQNLVYINNLGLFFFFSLNENNHVNILQFWCKPWHSKGSLLPYSSGYILNYILNEACF